MRYYDSTGKKHNTWFGAFIIGNDPGQTASVEKKPSFRFSGKVDLALDIADGIYNKEPIIDTGNDSTRISEEIPPVVDESNQSGETIDPDYAHGKIVLRDKEGNKIAESDMDDRLKARTVDKSLSEILYPDENIPDDVSMNIQSIQSSSSPIDVDTNTDENTPVMG